MQSDLTLCNFSHIVEEFSTVDIVLYIYRICYTVDVFCMPIRTRVNFQYSVCHGGWEGEGGGLSIS